MKKLNIALLSTTLLASTVLGVSLLGGIAVAETSDDSPPYLLNVSGWKKGEAFHVVCLDGVKYIVFTNVHFASGAITPKLTKTFNPELCTN